MLNPVSNFSVIMAVYNGDNATYLDAAIQSLINQTVTPSEIIVVIDGFINDSLKNCIAKYENNEVFVFKYLEENGGLAKALNEALKIVKYDYIARMDADDVCVADRFEKQLAFLKLNDKVDVVGMFVDEINEDDQIIKRNVKVPLLHDEILNLMKKRNPMIHPTVMFRKRFFEKAGVYQNDLILVEDYQLWYKGFMNNCYFANIPEVGLLFRRTTSFYKRRGSFKKVFTLLMFKLRVMNRDLKFGLDADIYSILYFLMQISPNFIKKALYKWLR